MSETKTVYRGSYIQVNEKVIDNQVWEMAYFRESCVIFAITPNLEFIIIDEKRPHETPPIRKKFVTGHVDPGEEVLLCANRELQEEAKLKASTMKSFYTHRATGSINSVFHYILAQDLEESVIPNPDGEDTILKVNKVHYLELENLILDHHIPWGLSCMGAIKIISLMKKHGQSFADHL